MRTQTMDHTQKKKNSNSNNTKKITIEQRVIENEQDHKIRIKILLLTC